LDFAEFDARPADLDLVVAAAGERHVAAGQVPAEVTGPEQPVSWSRAEGVRAERVLGQRFVTEVSGREVRAPDADFPELTDPRQDARSRLDDKLRASDPAA
jgi:hypothetical protein